MRGCYGACSSIRPQSVVDGGMNRRGEKMVDSAHQVLLNTPSGVVRGGFTTTTEVLKVYLHIHDHNLSPCLSRENYDRFAFTRS